MLKFNIVIYILWFLIASCNPKESKYTRIQVTPVFDAGADTSYHEAKGLLMMRATNLLGASNCRYNIKENGYSFLIEIEEGCSTIKDFITVLDDKEKGKLQFYISSSDVYKKELIRNGSHIVPCKITSTEQIPFLIGCMSDTSKIKGIAVKIRENDKLNGEKIITYMFDKQQLWLVEKQTFVELDNDDIVGVEEVKEDVLEIKISPLGVELLNRLVKGKKGENLIITIDEKAIYYLPISKNMKFHEKTIIGNLHPTDLIDLKNSLLVGYVPFYFEVKILN